MGKQEHYEQVGYAVTCRSFGEYARMFDISLCPDDEILDVAAGASSFAAGARMNGFRAVSVDPMYTKTPAEMEQTAYKELEEAAEKLSGLLHKFDWSYYGSIEEHSRIRRDSVELFLKDYARLFGTASYVPAVLPELPFGDGRFTRIFCSHFLFLYAEVLSHDFHMAALHEMARVLRPGGEIRIYPLLDMKHRPYGRLKELMAELESAGMKPELLESRLPFIPGSCSQLRIIKPPQETIASEDCS